MPGTFRGRPTRERRNLEVLAEGEALMDGEALTELDWTDVVLLVDLLVGSSRHGVQQDWHPCTGQHIEEAWDDLAAVQRIVRSRFLGSTPRTILFSGRHEGRRLRVWTFDSDGVADVDWRALVGVQAPADESGTAPLDVRLDRRADGTPRVWITGGGDGP